MDDKPKSLTKDQITELLNLIQSMINEGRSDGHSDVAPWHEAPNDWWQDPIEIPGLRLKITSKNYYEIQPDGTKKEYFTWDEAMEIEKKTDGVWRLPTAVEITKIVCALGEKDGDIDRDTLVEALKLEQRGWANADGDIRDYGDEGNWWTSTETSADNARSLGTNTTYVNPRLSSGKGYGFSVRCVAASS